MTGKPAQIRLEVSDSFIAEGEKILQAALGHKFMQREFGDGLRAALTSGELRVTLLSTGETAYSHKGKPLLLLSPPLISESRGAVGYSLFKSFRVEVFVDAPIEPFFVRSEAV